MCRLWLCQEKLLSKWLGVWRFLIFFCRFITSFQRLNQALLCTHLLITQETHLELWGVWLLEHRPSFCWGRLQNKKSVASGDAETHTLHPVDLGTNIQSLGAQLLLDTQEQEKAPGTSSKLMAYLKKQAQEQPLALSGPFPKHYQLWRKTTADWCSGLCGSSRKNHTA